MVDLLSELGEIGFTEYEAKVYLALLKDHPATGYQLSKQAGIPRSMVYEALGRLDARGAVLKTEEAKATLYRPMPPDSLLDRIHDEHERRIHVLREELEVLYTTRDEGHLWTFAGEGPILSYAENMLTSARYEAMLVLTDDNLHRLHDAIVDADKRGVEIGALLTGNERLEVGQVSYHPPHESVPSELITRVHGPSQWSAQQSLCRNDNTLERVRRRKGLSGQEPESV